MINYLRALLNDIITSGIPVMRLDGSKTSIFSARSMAIGDKSGNFCGNDCFGTQGSCLTYFRAFSLLRNPRSESSGVPNSCGNKHEIC